MEEKQEPPSLKTSDVADKMGVGVKTVTRWAVTGSLRAAVTPGGHRRYYLSDVEAMLSGRAPLQATWYKAPESKKKPTT